jgi:hypothetical protein
LYDGHLPTETALLDADTLPISGETVLQASEEILHYRTPFEGVEIPACLE